MTEPVEPPPDPMEPPPDATGPPAGLPAAPVTAAPRFPTWKQSIILIVSGAVLALTSCFGFVIAAASYPTLQRNEGLIWLVLTIVASGALGAVGGVLLLFWLIVRALLGRPTR